MNDDRIIYLLERILEKLGSIEVLLQDEGGDDSGELSLTLPQITALSPSLIMHASNGIGIINPGPEDDDDEDVMFR